MAAGSDNGWSDNGSPDDLPDLPEEWGVIVIPDDLSELSDEVDAIRAELKLAEHPSRWRRLLNRPGARRLRRLGLAALRAPVLIISMAILVTVASLVASAWPGPPRQPVVQRSSDNEDTLDSLPALELFDAKGQPASLSAHLPAVILVTDGCPCDTLISATIAAAKSRPQIAVVVISGAPGTPAAGVAPSTAASAAATPATQTTPQAETPSQSVVVLHDPPNNSVRDQLKLGKADGTAAALLVDKTGRVVHEVNRTVTVDEFQPYLARI